MPAPNVKKANSLCKLLSDGDTLALRHSLTKLKSRWSAWHYTLLAKKIWKNDAKTQWNCIAKIEQRIPESARIVGARNVQRRNQVWASAPFHPSCSINSLEYIKTVAALFRYDLRALVLQCIYTTYVGYASISRCKVNWEILPSGKLRLDSPRIASYWSNWKSICSPELKPMATYIFLNQQCSHNSTYLHLVVAWRVI